MTSAWFAFVEAANFERRALNFSSRLRGASLEDAVSLELVLIVGGPYSYGSELRHSGETIISSVNLLYNLGGK